MGRKTRFIQQSVARAPVLLFSSVFNRWSFSWFVLASLAGAGYVFSTKDMMSADSAMWQWLLWSLVPVVVAPLLTGLFVLYLHDKTQVNEPVQRVFPVLFWGRRFLMSSGPPLRQYLFAGDREETPFNRITRNWVYQTARGIENTIGFGSQNDMTQVGAVVALPATFTNEASKTGEEFGSAYRKVIGQHTGVEPYVMEHFVAISAMSFGALSFNAHAALNLGAKRANILHNCGEGGLAACHEYGGGDLVFQIGTAKYGVRSAEGTLDEAALARIGEHPQVKLVEIKLAQGAKPGKGGMLLKEKITPEIAAIRKIPLGQDSHSPPRHAEVSNVNELFDFIDRVRQISKKPVGIKMVIGHTEEIESIAEKMAKEPGRGPDYIAIDGGDGGTGAAPLVLASHCGLPIRQAIAVADWAFKQYGVRDRIVLFAGGQIATPIDIAVAMALGADAVHIARGFMLALGCIQALECHTNHCPTGIATQDKKLQKALDIEAAASRVATYANALYKETQMLAESCGYVSPSEIKSDDIMVVTSPGHLDYLSELHAVSAFEASLERKKARHLKISVGEMKMRGGEEID